VAAAVPKAVEMIEALLKDLLHLETPVAACVVRA
jgi:hypothetical protein